MPKPSGSLFRTPNEPLRQRPPRRSRRPHALPELLRFAHFPDSIAANMRLLIYGLLLVLMARFRPQGLAGEYRFQ